MIEQTEKKLIGGPNSQREQTIINGVVIQDVNINCWIPAYTDEEWNTLCTQGRRALVYGEGEQS